MTATSVSADRRLPLGTLDNPCRRRRVACPGAAALACLLAIAQPVSAQERNPFAWPAHRQAANVASGVLVGANMAGETLHAWRQPERGRALRCLALRNAITIGVSETVKRLVHRTRPNGADGRSFWSEHTALAATNAGWRWGVGLSVTGGAGYLRMASNWHFPSDVAVGFGAGLISRSACRP